MGKDKQKKPSLLPALALLAPHKLVLVAHAFPLVRLWRPQLPDVGSKLPDLGLVSARDEDRRRLLDLNLERLGDLHLDGVRETQVERQLASRNRRAVSHADHSQSFGEARRGSDHHVGGQSTDEAVCGVGGAGLDLLVDAEGAVLELLLLVVKRVVVDEVEVER